MPSIFVLRFVKTSELVKRFFYVCREFKNVLKLVLSTSVLERVHVHRHPAANPRATPNRRIKKSEPCALCCANNRNLVRFDVIKSAKAASNIRYAMGSYKVLHRQLQ